MHCRLAIFVHKTFFWQQTDFENVFNNNCFDKGNV